MSTQRPARPNPYLVPVQQSQLWEVVANGLRQAIIAGELKPGAKLVETELAEQFHVSRGPIREALQELARGGFVIDIPRRGTFVSTITLADLTEVYEIREGLESMAVTKFAREGTDEDLDKVRISLEASEALWKVADAKPSPKGADYARALAADSAFHREIIRITGNGRMNTVYDQMTQQTEMLIRTALDVNPTLRWSPPRRVHRDIYDALRARDEARARAAVRSHFEHTRERLVAKVAPTKRSPGS
ncbi:MAG TPA: GntR family transcriptional regulator [Candidatus Dormibacteraeota bacterium]